jgi:ubiquinone/menaquinone biosynthesis C-methylase UbiE
MMIGDVDRFDRRATGYEREWLHERFHDPVRRATLDVAARLQPDANAVLDVGCGTGALLRLVPDRFPGARRAGIDPSAAMIVHADGAGAELVEACAEWIPFPDRTFDLVLSTLSFHHWLDQAQGLREIARVLAPGGLLVLADRLLRGRAEDLVNAAGLAVDDIEPVFSLGPFPVASALSARKPRRAAPALAARAQSGSSER